MSFYKLQPTSQKSDLSSSQNFLEPLDEFHDNQNSKISFAQAKRHSRAIKVGLVDKEIQSHKCSCCGRYVNKKDFKMNCSIFDLSVLGIGYPLYFKFHRCVMYLLLLLCVIHTIPSLIINLLGNDCQNTDPASSLITNECNRSIFNSLSFPNKRNDERQNGLQMILDTVMFYFILVAVFWTRLHMAKQIYSLRLHQGLEINDFAVILYGLPKIGTSFLNKKLSELFEEKIKIDSYTYEIEDISYIYDTKRYLELTDKKELLQEKLNNLTFKKSASLHSQLEILGPITDEVESSGNKSIDKIEKSINKILRELKEIEHSYQLSKTEKSEIFTGSAIITLSTFEAKYFVYKNFSAKAWTSIVYSKICKFCCHKKNDSKSKIELEGCKIVIEESVHPTNILWENFAISLKKRLFQKLLAWFIAMVLFLICFLMIGTGSNYQMKFRTSMLITTLDLGVRSSKFYLLQIYTLLFGGIILLFKNVTIEILKVVIRLEKFVRHTRLETSIADKLSLQYFFSSSFCIFVVSVYYHNVWKYGGMISLVFYYGITSVLCKCCLPFCDPFYLWKIYQQRKFNIKKVKNMTQAALNNLFVLDDFPIALYTAGILSTFYHCLFFSSLVPATNLLFLAVWPLEHWIHKYIIINRCGAERKIGGDLSIRILNLFDRSLIIYAIGTALTYYIMLKEIPKCYFVNIFISFLYNIIPRERFARNISEPPQNLLKQTYKEKRNNFGYSTYKNLNPVRFIKFMHLR